MFRSPRSTEPTYVRWSPARSASASWLRPRDARTARTRSPNATRGSAGSVTRQPLISDAYRSTDYE